MTMADGTHIEWTDSSWPVTSGCDDESPGCLNCYAKRDSHRLAGNPNPKISSVYAGTTERRPGGPIRWTGVLKTLPDRLDWPLKWRKHRRIFVGNMSDLFHPSVPSGFIDEVFAVMLACRVFENIPDHTFQVLTKRAERLAAYFAARSPSEHLKAWAEAGRGWIICDDEDVCFHEYVGSLTYARFDEDHAMIPGTDGGAYSQTAGLFPLPNVHLGVSVEDRRRKTRIDRLRETPAAVRFLSVEPLLEDLGPLDLTGIHWVILGGESGPVARPMHLDWARSIRDQCVAAGVRFFFKQWGGWVPDGQAMPWLKDVAGGRGAHESRVILRDGRDVTDDRDAMTLADPGTVVRRVGKKSAGRMLDGRTWDQFPEAVAPAIQ
jgi:protein gp37